MKLYQKLGKLGRPSTYHRGWRRAQRSIFRLPFRKIMTRQDREGLRAIQKRYQDSQDPYARYANIDHWLRVNRERVQDLKLHCVPPQRVLDLGCGGGFFLFILKRLGHSVLGLDAQESPLFTELIEFFGIPRVRWKIKPFELLPDLGTTFDWITAFSIAFDRYPDRRRWKPAEWDFLLQDLQSRLASGGKIFFGLNPMSNGEYWTAELHDFFVGRGAVIERERIFFRKGVCVSKVS